jgi:hypothetical protein
MDNSLRNNMASVLQLGSKIHLPVVYQNKMQLVQPNPSLLMISA